MLTLSAVVILAEHVVHQSEWTVLQVVFHLSVIVAGIAMISKETAVDLLRSVRPFVPWAKRATPQGQRRPSAA